MAYVKFRYIQAGALIRGDIKRVFLECEKHGGTVTYKEHKGFFETTFTGVSIEGPDWLIDRAWRTLKGLTES